VLVTQPKKPHDMKSIPFCFRFAAWLLAGVLAAGCASQSPSSYGAKNGPLTVPPDVSGTQLPPGDGVNLPHAVTELTLASPFARAWLQVGSALERCSFTVVDRDRSQGVYVIRYADPMDRSAAEQGFWSQLVDGRKEKSARQYRIGLRTVTPQQTRVAIIDDLGRTDTSRTAAQIMTLLVSQLH
jgi:outer membrane protein assembly factor BamC